MRRSIVTLITVSMMVPCENAFGQALPPIQPGNWVRVSAPDAGDLRVVGLFSGHDSQRIGVKPQGEQNTVWIRLTPSTRIEQSSGQESHVVEGALIGLLFGGIAGGVIASATHEECVSEGWFDCFMAVSKKDATIIGSLAGGLLGAGVGAVIGWAIKTERWEEVPLDRLQLNMVPLRDGGFALGVSVTF